MSAKPQGLVICPSCGATFPHGYRPGDPCPQIDTWGVACSAILTAATATEHIDYYGIEAYLEEAPA